MEIIDNNLVNDAHNLVYNSLNCIQYCSVWSSQPNTPSNYCLKFTRNILNTVSLSYFAVHFVIGCFRVFFFWQVHYYYVSFEPNEFHSNWLNFNTENQLYLFRMSISLQFDYVFRSKFFFLLRTAYNNRK